MKKKLWIYLITFFGLVTINMSIAQDIIYKIDHTEIKSKVIEITTLTVRYKNFNHLNGPIRNISINDVFMIIYEDGKREVFDIKNNDTLSVIKSVINDTISARISAETDTLRVGKSGINNTLIKKDNVYVKVVDKRDNPFIIGDIPVSIFTVSSINPRSKIKDKQGILFPYIENTFKEKLNNEGFLSEKSDSSLYSLEITVNELYYKEHDKYTHMQVDQICSANITLSRINDNQIIYSTELSSSYSCKRADLKRMGYKYKGWTFFAIVVKDIIKQLMKNDEFQSHFNKI